MFKSKCNKPKGTGQGGCQTQSRAERDRKASECLPLMPFIGSAQQPPETKLKGKRLTKKAVTIGIKLVIWSEAMTFVGASYPDVSHVCFIRCVFNSRSDSECDASFLEPGLSVDYVNKSTAE